MELRLQVLLLLRCVTVRNDGDLKPLIDVFQKSSPSPAGRDLMDRGTVLSVGSPLEAFSLPQTITYVPHACVMLVKGIRIS